MNHDNYKIKGKKSPWNFLAKSAIQKPFFQRLSLFFSSESAVAHLIHYFPGNKATQMTK